MIYTAGIYKHNGELIEKVEKLYLKKGFKIADVTYGEGVFWKNIDLKKYKFFKSDIQTCPEASYDFRDLPYASESMDVVVLDPPYAHNPGKTFMINHTYKNIETTTGMYHKDIIKMYEDGMVEAKRILKKNGRLWVKCKDEIETSKQRWSHIEIYNIAIKLELYPKDLFIFVQNSKPYVQKKEQQHARKNHSYLWIFENN
jgi:tRNA G10  N-methylase Trm11